MEKITIDSQLERLGKMITDYHYYTHFSRPADPKKITLFEKKFQVKLPVSHKKFLEKFNGGMMLYDYQDEFLQTQSDYDACKGEAVYLLSIEEITNRYIFLKDMYWKVNNEIRPYPVIPFCSLPNNELLVFINGIKSGNESPVFDVFHEDFPNEWGILAPDFTTFLKAYLDKLGHPKTIGSMELGVASDYFNAPDETETPDEVLARTEALLLAEPEHAFYYSERATAFQKMDDLKAAFAAICQTIDLAPDDAYYYFIRGEILRDAKKYRQALIDFDRAVNLKADDAFYHCCRAEILFGLHKINKALDDCNTAIELDAKCKLAFMMRSEIYSQMGESEKAAADNAIVAKLDEEPD